MNYRDIIDLIEMGRESRRVEMKESMDFGEKRVRAKIAKAAMGMSNTRDGGVIILGMKEVTDEKFEPLGVDPAHLERIDQDRVSSAVMEYAAPYVVITLHRITDEERSALQGKTFVLLDVAAFDDIPVICKRQYQNEGLREGAVFIRSFERNETREIQTEAEMRELLDLATEKRLRRHIALTERAGGLIFKADGIDRESLGRFEEQAKEF